MVLVLMGGDLGVCWKIYNFQQKKLLLLLISNSFKESIGIIFIMGTADKPIKIIPTIFELKRVTTSIKLNFVDPMIC